MGMGVVFKHNPRLPAGRLWVPLPKGRDLSRRKIYRTNKYF